jgi:3-hydroxyisobutyrate dehydrogenase-like beta-hydroxyacid dehydrogenase
MNAIGQPMSRTDGHAKVTGRACYSAEHKLPGLTHAVMVNSTIPKGRIIGVASAVKMCRSVMIKGMEAMVIESLVSARKFGVEQHVLASLAETFPGIDWPKEATFFFSRAVQHGKRRAEEMRESARTVGEAGLDPWMPQATANRQDWVAKLAATGAFADCGNNASWQTYADRMLAAIERQASKSA